MAVVAAILCGCATTETTPQPTGTNTYNLVFPTPHYGTNAP